MEPLKAALVSGFISMGIWFVTRSLAELFFADIDIWLLLLGYAAGMLAGAIILTIGD